MARFARRMAIGGLFLVALTAEERTKLGIEKNKMALGIQHIGQYGAHATAKRAGFKKGDVIIGFDGRDDLLNEADLFRHGVTKRKIRDRVAIKILRNGTQKTLTIPMQK